MQTSWNGWRRSNGARRPRGYASVTEGQRGRIVRSLDGRVGREVEHVQDRAGHGRRVDPVVGVVRAALLLVHLLLHRGGGAAGVDGRDAHAVLPLLATEGVGQRAQSVLGRGVRRPVGRGGQTGAGVHEDDRAARGAEGRQRDPGQHRRSDDVDRQLLLPGARSDSSATGPRSTTPAAWTTESSRSGMRSASPVDLRRRPRGRRRAPWRRGSRSAGRAARSVDAGQQDQVVAALEQAVGEGRADAGARRR